MTHLNLTIEISKQKVHWEFMHEPYSWNSHKLSLHTFAILIHVTLLKEYLSLHEILNQPISYLEKGRF